jgi:hypothetical protein
MHFNPRDGGRIAVVGPMNLPMGLGNLANMPAEEAACACDQEFFHGREGCLLCHITSAILAIYGFVGHWVVKQNVTIAPCPSLFRYN